MAPDLKAFATEIEADLSVLREIVAEMEAGTLRTEKVGIAELQDTTFETIATIRATIALHERTVAHLESVAAFREAGRALRDQ